MEVDNLVIKNIVDLLKHYIDLCGDVTLPVPAKPNVKSFSTSETIAKLEQQLKK